MSLTKEYLRLRHKINPVIGWVEMLVVRPLEGLSEEHTECDAMQWLILKTICRGMGGCETFDAVEIGADRRRMIERKTLP